MTVDLVTAIRSDLRVNAQSERAPRMQAYMKSAMPYLGVPLPEVRRIVRARALQHPTGPGYKDAVLLLWHEATHREERYAATALLDVPSVRSLRNPGQLPLLHDLVVDGAWWDHVDELAHRVGELLRFFPTEVGPALTDWQRADDLWLRRVSIICQLGRKAETDVDRLAAAVDANAADRDFFVRKAIGWALRDYARTDPDWVRSFVAERELSPLSRREALKHLS